MPLKIIIEKVSNGWIVSEPKEYNPYEGLKEVVNANDLQHLLKKEENDSLENVRIANDFIEVLKYLEKYV